MLIILGCGTSGSPKPDLGHRLAALESSVSALRSEFDEVEKKAEQFSDGFTDWKDVVGELESEMGDLSNAVDSLESATSNLRSEFDVVFEQQPKEKPY